MTGKTPDSAPPDSAIDETLETVERELLALRRGDAHWRGELSTSALSTATAAFALATVDKAAGVGDVKGDHEALVRGGLDWLASHANPDGGWGDTVRSASNVSTTTLCWAALGAAAAFQDRYRGAIDAAEGWLRRQTRQPELTPARLAFSIGRVYGNDRTFSAPILTMCALAGRLGQGKDAWTPVAQLPFELAVLPRRLFPLVGLRVVSYALPALIAVGLVRHGRLPNRNPLVRAARNLARPVTLRLLGRIQPSNGGFLEAVPLTSFVAMSLAGSGLAGHPVTRRCVQFLTASVRPDGSWPIDTDLATWTTTLSVNALAERGRLDSLTEAERESIRAWLLAQQYGNTHPYTNAPPGGWAWTDLPGGVPDADDTAGALLALRNLSGGEDDEAAAQAAARGLRWLLGVQNRDGGIPTFCRGWGKLPFDRSCADLTAHALRAFLAWRDHLPPKGSPVRAAHLDTALNRGITYLKGTQDEDGSWAPLWFGNEAAPGHENRTYGTARVLRFLGELAGHGDPATNWMRLRAASWLLGTQNADGGWGGAPAVASSIEETAVAAEALAAPCLMQSALREEITSALQRAAARLVGGLESGEIHSAAPIGFYFAKLWYFEKLYPWIFTLSALGRVRKWLRCG